ncbi:hypothetical protein BS17DRAFT_770273 [Gyrodon lividus]|nr:hypothetical protein BS17DRAFT_770273 [Gyrodon lividus]
MALMYQNLLIQVETKSASMKENTMTGPTALTHPKLKVVANLGLSYLETGDGEPGKAPKIWGRLSASASELFNLLMEMAHPLFKFAKDNWKLKMLATQSYPAWCALNLNEDCWLFVKSRKGIKVEGNKNAVTVRKRKGGNSLTRTSGKHFKVKGDKENSPSPAQHPPILLSNEPEDHYAVECKELPSSSDFCAAPD